MVHTGYAHEYTPRVNAARACFTHVRDARFGAWLSVDFHRDTAHKARSVKQACLGIAWCGHVRLRSVNQSAV